MRELGISVYPAKSSEEKDYRYIDKAFKYGFTRIFTNLISVENDKELLERFKRLCLYAKRNNMKVIADINPEVLKNLGISFEDIEFFYNLGLYGIRFDTGSGGFEESFTTYNPYNLKIEINMSSGVKYMESIMEYKPNLENLMGCHNFYPLRYTGISRKHFEKCSIAFKSYNIPTAAFITSHNNATFGPWPDSDGLCTLEEHRNLPIETQAKDLFNTGLIDTVIIGDCYASEDELRVLGSLDKNILALNVELEEGISDIEKKIVLEEPHFNRGDISEYLIRSTLSRIKYKDNVFKVFNPVKQIKKGDILIPSSEYKRYAGELQIALKDMENSGKINVVAKVVPEEVFLLEYIQPWQKFKLKLK